jgi:hypothetical protein
VKTIEKPQEIDVVYNTQPDLTPMTPEYIQVAQDVYRAYCNVHGASSSRPTGVAVDCQSLRGHLIFSQQPILLPHECFIPLELLDAGDDNSQEYWEE